MDDTVALAPCEVSENVKTHNRRLIRTKQVPVVVRIQNGLQGPRTRY